MKVSLNGLIVNQSEASIPVASDGLFYGAGCFETFKSYKGKFLHLDRHLSRLKDAQHYLTGLDTDILSEKELRSQIADLLDVNSLTDKFSKIRIQVSLGECHGYSLQNSNDSTVVTLITAEEIQVKSIVPYHLTSVNTTVVPASCRPTQLKLSNMMHYRQAAIEAKGKGADDSLMLTVRGEVAETSIANIFWEKKGKVFTPSITCDILPGITRSVVLELLNELGDEVRVGEYSLSDIEHASQVWICNSIKELVWVTSLNGRSYSTNTELKTNLLQLFEQHKKEILV